jgi:hypothetical protein
MFNAVRINRSGQNIAYTFSYMSDLDCVTLKTKLIVALSHVYVHMAQTRVGWTGIPPSQGISAITSAVYVIQSFQCTM